MAGLGIKSIEISDSGFLSGVAAELFVERLSAKLSTFALRAVSGRQKKDFSYYVCSSTLDMASSGGWFDPADLSRRIHRATGLWSSYSNAMQCASWGFLVRHHLANKPDVPNILLAIVDANPLGMQFWVNNDSWGRTGHRVTLVHLQLPQPIGDSSPLMGPPNEAIVIGKCNPAAMLYDYAREIQSAMARFPAHTLAIPYFEAKMRKGIKRNIGEYAYLSDLYEEYGHLCGADPWVSIVRDRGGVNTADKCYVASSIASEGYFCFLPTMVDRHSMMRIEEEAWRC